jgi:hypothetical protein
MFTAQVENCRGCLGSYANHGPMNAQPICWVLIEPGESSTVLMDEPTMLVFDESTDTGCIVDLVRGQPFLVHLKDLNWSAQAQELRDTEALFKLQQQIMKEEEATDVSSDQVDKRMAEPPPPVAKSLSQATESPPVESEKSLRLRLDLSWEEEEEASSQDAIRQLGFMTLPKEEEEESGPSYSAASQPKKKKPQQQQQTLDKFMRVQKKSETGSGSGRRSQRLKERATAGRHGCKFKLLTSGVDLVEISSSSSDSSDSQYKPPGLVKRKYRILSSSEEEEEPKTLKKKKTKIIDID